jgi:hypothetical protein
MAVPQEPAERSSAKVIALILAVFFLAVIGASAGYILGLRHKHAAARHTAQQTNEPPPPAPASRPAGGKACLSETERDAKQKFNSPGGLAQTFYLLTNKSEVWICKDSAGTVFYQGHVRSDAERQGGARPPLVDLQNSLLLKTVSSDGKGGWIAENQSGGGVTKYTVTAQELVVEQPNRKPDHQPAIRHEP